MSHLKCTTESCSEYDIPKANSGNLPADEVTCGECWQPVTETTASKETVDADPAN